MQAFPNPYAQQYKQHRNQGIENADPVTIITMLLEGAISYNKKAIEQHARNDIKGFLEHVHSSFKIVVHLYNCLNFEKGGAVAEKLGSLYNYSCDQFLTVQRDTKSVEPLHSVNQILQTILDGWKQLPKT